MHRVPGREAEIAGAILPIDFCSHRRTQRSQSLCVFCDFAAKDHPVSLPHLTVCPLEPLITRCRLRRTRMNTDRIVSLSAPYLPPCVQSNHGWHRCRLRRTQMKTIRLHLCISVTAKPHQCTSVVKIPSRFTTDKWKRPLDDTGRWLGDSERWLEEKGARCAIRLRFQHVFLNLMDFTSERSAMKSYIHEILHWGEDWMGAGVDVVFEIMRMRLF